MKIILERKEYSQKPFNEEAIDKLVSQICAQPLPEEQKNVFTKLYKHSMFAPIEIIEGDIESLKNRTPGIKRLGQGFEGIVEIFFTENTNFCIKRKYGIGDEKEQRSFIEKDCSYQREFEIQEYVFSLATDISMPIMHVEIIILDSRGMKIEDLSTELFLMEVIHGQTLLKFTKENVEDRNALQMAFKKLKSNLDKLHNNGVFHGDLHLENIMVSIYKKGNRILYRLHLIDFGKAYFATEDMFSNLDTPWAKTDDELYQVAYDRYFTEYDEN